jgi:hypothetical protein
MNDGWRVPSRSFWRRWRRDKEAMQAEGYRVRRTRGGMYLVAKIGDDCSTVEQLKPASVEASVIERDDGFVVMDGSIVMAGPFASNAAAWRWLDANDDRGRADTDRYNRLRIAFADQDK